MNRPANRGLVLTRKRGQVITIGEYIRVTVLDFGFLNHSVWAKVRIKTEEKTWEVALGHKAGFRLPHPNSGVCLALEGRGGRIRTFAPEDMHIGRAEAEPNEQEYLVVFMDTADERLHYLSTKGKMLTKIEEDARRFTDHVEAFRIGHNAGKGIPYIVDAKDVVS